MKLRPLLVLSLSLAGSLSAQSLSGTSPGGKGPVRDAGPPRFLRGPFPSFSGPVDFELSGSEPADTEVADFDGDGHLDLCICGSGGTDVSVLYGDGLGDFSTAEDTHVVLSAYDPGPWGVTSGDFDGDGLLDFAVALGGSYNGLGQPNHKVHLFLNDGDRKFVWSTTVLSSGRFPIDCAAGDFDEDGELDLAVVANASGLDFFPGLGDGTFGARRTVAAHPNGLRLKAVDLDADGHLDLVASKAGTFPGQLAYWGDGTGWAGGPIGSVFLNPGYGFAFADVNLDGHLDVLSSAPDKFPNYTGGLWVLLGRGGRSFTGGGRYGTAFTGAISAGDVNRDGLPDVFGLDGLGIRTYIGEGNGSFLQDVHLPTGLQPTDLVLGDWNQDGLDDVASPYRNLGDTPYVTVLLNVTE